MILPLTITKDYILLAVDDEYANTSYNNGVVWKKVLAHLPLGNTPALASIPYYVTLLPPLPNDDVWSNGLEEKLNELPYSKHIDDGLYNDGQVYGFEQGAVWGFSKAKEKYKFTEDDIRKAIAMGYDWCHQKQIPHHWMIDNFIQSLSQPKLPTHFKIETEPYTVGEMSLLPLGTPNQKPKIINGVMQGEWIFEPK